VKETMIANVKLLFVLGSVEALHADASERELNEMLITTDKRWQVHLVSSRILHYKNLMCDYKSHRVSFIPSPNSIVSRAVYVFFLTIKSATIVKKYHIQAIMSKSGHLILGLAAYLTSRITNKKCIIRVNEDQVMDIILFIKTHRVPIIRNNTFLRIIEKLSRRIENYLFKHADWIVTQGPMDYERIRKITEKVTFLPLWVDTEKFRPTSTSQVSHLRKELLKLGNVKVIMFVGRLESDKDLETLLYAIKSLSEVRNDVVLVVIGTGSEQKRYIELTRQLGIADKVRFLGYIRHDEIAKYYNIADVYVLPSVWEEWSNTIMEAMASGIPVIATNVGANPYLVKEEETGFLFPVRNFNVLAKKIAYVLDHKSEVNTILSKARLSMQKYTKQDIGESYKKVIENVILGK